MTAEWILSSPTTMGGCEFSSTRAVLRVRGSVCGCLPESATRMVRKSNSDGRMLAPSGGGCIRMGVIYRRATHALWWDWVTRPRLTNSWCIGSMEQRSAFRHLPCALIQPSCKEAVRSCPGHESHHRRPLFVYARRRFGGTRPDRYAMRQSARSAAHADNGSEHFRTCGCEPR